MSEKTVLFEKQGPVALVTLNRPAALNCFNEEMWQEMEQVLGELEQDLSVRAVVLKAAGDKFSAGIDLSLLGSLDSDFIWRNLPCMQQLNNRWENLMQPVIAAVQGICFGAGTELVLACDIRLASTRAVFGIQEVQFGLSPDMGGSQRLTRVVGASQAKRLILTCDTIDAREALRIGLVDLVYEPEELLPAALAMAEKIASRPPLAVRFAKKAINVAQESSLYAGLLFEQAQSIHCLGTQDKNEAVAAFFEKRLPQFKGK